MTNPEYLAQISHKVRKIDQHNFVKTIVFDMFGDVSDVHLETKMLQIFRRGMEIEYARTDLSTVLRDNKSLIILMKTYATRGQGQTIIKEILAKPVKDVFDQTNLVLEIDVNKVYQHVIQTYEMKTDKAWPRQRQVSTETANESPFVQQLCKPRIAQLEFIAKHFLDRIVSNVDKVAWGVRWICKQIAELTATTFPEATKYQIGSL
eukprot:UN27978